MTDVTIAHLPLLAGDSGYVSRTPTDLGLDTEVLQTWLRICESIRSFCLRMDILDTWPPAVLYADADEAMEDQLHPHCISQLFDQVKKAHGWAVFGTFHSCCLPQWEQMDRSVLHLTKLGGPTPISRTLLHEAGHHHLYQKHGIAFHRHCKKAERRIKAISRVWLRKVAPEIRDIDTGASIRALDILLQQARNQYE